MNTFQKVWAGSALPWSSLVEGDEPLYWPTVKQLWNYPIHVLHNFFGFNINTTAFCLGLNSLQHLLQKSSMALPIFIQAALISVHDFFSVCKCRRQNFRLRDSTHHHHRKCQHHTNHESGFNALTS